MYIDVAWECLKRNDEYINDWVTHSSNTNGVSERNSLYANKWGLVEFINPKESCVTDVFWLQQLSSRSINIALSEFGDITIGHLVENSKFNHKIMKISSGEVCIKLYNEHSYFQFFIETEEFNLINLKEKFICVSLKHNFLNDLKRLNAFLFEENEPQKDKKEMNFMKIYDKLKEGFSHKDIAYALFPEEAKNSNWHSDSWLRARVRYSIRKAKYMVNGGYYSFL